MSGSEEGEATQSSDEEADDKVGDGNTDVLGADTVDEEACEEIECSDSRREERIWESSDETYCCRVSGNLDMRSSRRFTCSSAWGSR